MLAYRFVRHSIIMVWSNRANVARIAGPLAAATLGLQLILFYGYGVDVLAGDDIDSIENPGALVPVLLLYLLSGLAGLWVYVGWHRFVLLEDYPAGYWPAVPVDRMLAYLGISLLIGLVIFGIFAGAGMVLALVTGGGSGGGLLATVLGVAGFLAVIVLTSRLSVALPAAAIGRPIGLKGAWQATEGGSVDCALGLILMLVAAILIAAPGGILSSLLPAPLNFVVMLPFSIFVAFAGVSYLTTLYGYYVEKRDLV